MSLSLEIMDDKEINQALKSVLGIVEMEQERDFVSNAELFDHLLSAFSSQLNTQLTPNEISKDYVGVHLGKVYEDNDFKHLLKSFKNNQILDSFYALKIINDAQERLKKLPNIRECVLDDPLESGCIVVGDLHGNFNDLYHIIQKYGIPGSQYKFVFNGDFVDRGPKQCEVLLTLLYAFLIRPHKVFLNRGNHEDMSMNSSRNFSPNFMSSTKSYFGKYSTYMYSLINDLFAHLPLATILKNNFTNTKYFIVHGGISDSTDLEYISNQVNRFKFQKVSSFPGEENLEHKIVSDLLWSDPIRKEDGQIRPKSAQSLTGCYFNKQRNLGSLFGVDITEKFCKRYSFNALIRSHEMRDKGYSEDHTRCFTIFSASYYCGGNNFGSVFRFGIKDSSFEAYSYKNTTGDLSSLIVKKNNSLIKQFKSLIQKNQQELQAQFERVDPNKKGSVKTFIWADILSKHFRNEISPKNLISIKDLLCECESTLDVVNYKTLFTNSAGQLNKNNSLDNNNMINVIRNLFDILDRNNDKQISATEAKEALEFINQKVGQRYSVLTDCNNFIKNMDMNKDNVIDLEEFTRAFLGEDIGYDEHLEDHGNSEHSEDEDIQIVRL